MFDAGALTFQEFMIGESLRLATLQQEVPLPCSMGADLDSLLSLFTARRGKEAVIGCYENQRWQAMSN